MQLNYVHITTTFNGNTKTVLHITNEGDVMTAFDWFIESFDPRIKLIYERENKTFAEQILKASFHNENAHLVTSNDIFKVFFAGKNSSAQLYKTCLHYSKSNG